MEIGCCENILRGVAKDDSAVMRAGTFVSSMCPNSSSTGKVGCERAVNAGKGKAYVV